MLILSGLSFLIVQQVSAKDLSREDCILLRDNMFIDSVVIMRTMQHEAELLNILSKYGVKSGSMSNYEIAMREHIKWLKSQRASDAQQMPRVSKNLNRAIHDLCAEFQLPDFAGDNARRK
jgi:hypothetical protein